MDYRENQRLTAKQQIAIAALMDCCTIKAAARRARVSDRTVHRWLLRDNFRSAYRRARQDVVSQATARLRALLPNAVNSLQRLLQDEGPPTPARVEAVRTAFQYAFRAHELEDMTERIDKLEEEA